jgi:hypothetical protein
VNIRRRLVIYVQGYDPRGLAEYYRMFRREYRKACELYGLSGEVSRAENDSQRFISTWNVQTKGSGWQTATRYMLLRWEDIIRKDFARPAWWKIMHMLRIWGGIALVNGVVLRLLKAHWRFGLFSLYPTVLLIAWFLCAALAGVVCAKLVAFVGVSDLISILAGLAAATGAFALLLWHTESRTYLLYLCDDGVSTYHFAHGKRPDWEARLEIFAGYVVDAVRQSDADEVVVVGHSSGSFLAVDVLDRALARDQELGRHGPKLALLTVGANLPIVGFHPQAQWFRDRLRRLAVAPDIVWVDYQSRHDVMNFWPFDPITGHGIVLGPERRNPKVVAVNFRDLWIPQGFDRRRWRFFEAHFQFLRANERLGAAYDYYLICCGPFDLETRANRPNDVAMAVKSGPDGEPRIA